MAAAAPAPPSQLPAATLTVRAVFGVKGNAAANVLFAEEGSVIVPAAAMLVRHALASRGADAVPCAGRGVTAMALSNSRRFFAVAELGDAAPGGAGAAAPGATVAVYNVKTLAKRKAMSLAADGVDAGAQGVAALAFSGDDQSVAALCGAPGFAVALFSLDRGRLAARASVPLAGGMGGGFGLRPELVAPLGLAFAPGFGGRLAVWGRNAMMWMAVEELPPPPPAAPGFRRVARNYWSG